MGIDALCRADRHFGALFRSQPRQADPQIYALAARLSAASSLEVAVR